MKPHSRMEIFMRLFSLSILMGLFVSVAGCAESQIDGVGEAASGQSSSSETSATGATTTAVSGTTTGVTSSSVTSSSVTTGGGGPGGVVINELSGTGSDYIELFNAGNEMVDLSGIRVADQDMPGLPKLTSAVTLPNGTSLAPGSYLFILGGQPMASTAPETLCAPGPSPCFFATYKLSNKSGDEVFLVDKTSIVLESVTYPGNLATGETWGRLPNGTGSFATGAATPGAANQAP